MDHVPAGTHSPADIQHGGQVTSGRGRKGGSGRGKLKLIIVSAAILLVVLFFALIGWLIYRSSTAASIDGGKYQAVFLSNGQVYFGKLRHLNNSYMKLTDIFYLQTQTDTPDESDSQNPQETSQGADVRLIKLGNEVHGPEDEMIINKDEVLFFENLKADGKVSESINSYRQGQNN